LLDSEVSTDQIVRSFSATCIDFARGGVDQVAIRIEGTEKPILIEPHARLNTPQSILGYEKNSFHCAVMSPKPHGTAGGIIKAASIGKVERHRGVLFEVVNLLRTHRKIARRVRVFRRFGRVTLGFALRSFFVLSSLFFFAPRARCSLSFSPISAVVWLECHRNLFCWPVDIMRDTP